MVYGARLSSVPSGDGLPTLPRMVFQGAAISSEHTSQFLPPGKVAELRCSPPLRGSLEQLVRLLLPVCCSRTPKLATLITPEASFERLVPLVDYLAAWKLLPDVSRWVLHTVERGYRIQFGSPPPRCNRVNPTLEGPEQALVMEREVDALLREEAIEVVPPHKRESGFYSRYFISSQEGRRVASHFRSASVEPLSQQTEVQDAQNRSCLRSGRGLVCHDRSKRRILPYLHPSHSQEVPEVCFRGKRLPISGSSLPSSTLNPALFQSVWMPR